MLYVFITTLVLIGLRLIGDNSDIYKALAHTFVGLLGGYWLGTYEWLTGVCFVLLCLTEGYMFAAKTFPAILLSNLFKTTTVVTKK